MTIRLANPYNTDQTRCVIGRHRVEEPNFLFFDVDGKLLCREHAFEIVSELDRIYQDKTTEEKIIDAYRRVEKEDTRKRREASMRAVARTNEPGFVYYIRMDDLIKIGYAKDVTRRMRAYPPSAQLLAIHPGTPAVEKRMHDQFHAFLRRGREWFAPHEQILSHIEETRAKFGDPAPFAYSYTKSATA